MRLRGTVGIEHTLARRGAERLWKSLHKEDFVNALGALTGNQAMQQVKAGLQAIYLSPAGRSPPTPTSPARCIRTSRCTRPTRCRRWSSRSTTPCCAPTSCTTPKATTSTDWMVPIVADAEAGFGGVLNAFELMKAMIEAGAAGVHFEDQLASVKKCGHMGGKVLVPTREAVDKLNAARLAADVAGVPTLLVARTDADAADLLTSDIDANDQAVHHRRAHGRGLLPRHARAWTRRSAAASPTRPTPT